MMELYHGSNVRIEKPDFALCKPYKDFGKIAELIEELRYPKGITFQYFFGTQRALDKLAKI